LDTKGKHFRYEHKSWCPPLALKQSPHFFSMRLKYALLLLGWMCQLVWCLCSEIESAPYSLVFCHLILLW
jgi:hypothetical protein